MGLLKGIMFLHNLLAEEQSGILRFGGARMALLDIEAGFWGLRQQLEALVGHQLTDSALQQAGANGGAAFARAFAPDVTADTAVSIFRDCVAAYQAAGFGQFTVEIMEWPIGRVIVHGHNTFEAWMMQQHKQAEASACVYTAGVLVGFINVLTNRRDIVCIQNSCQAEGADECTFELIPATETNQTAVVAFDPNPGLATETAVTPPIEDEKEPTAELSALLAITQNIASALELEPMLHLILEQFKAVVAYDGAAVLELDGDALNILAYRGPIPQKDALRLRFPLTDSKANQAVIESREPVIISDVRGDTPLAHGFQAAAGTELETTFGYVRSWMGIPLISRDQVIGMLSLDHHQPNSYTGRHSLLALTFASKVAVAIENSRLYQEEQNRRRELQTLLDVAAAANSSLDLDEMLSTTMDRLVDLVHASRAGVLLWNEETGKLEPRLIRPERAIMAEDMAEMVQACQSVIDNGKALYIAPDVSKGFLEPGAFLPLRIRDRTLGLIGIIGAEAEQFSQGQLNLFQSIADQLAVAVENARLYEQAEQAAVAAERNRLARDLHDAVTQTLFSASLIADVLPRIWERDLDQGRARLEELRELTRGALAEMRTLLLELRPATLTETSLAELLRQLIQAVGGRSRLPIELIIEGERPLPPEIQVTLYRITQEALNNIAKHAGASQATLKLLFLPQAVSLSIQDNGRGFDPSNAPQHSLGLGIMRERAEKIGAQLTINSQIGEGTVVTVHIPLANGTE
ncbi:MAG: hypothetical protein CL608_25745 [Anaerolineaceae bacterium]|nr:hypothetical protein [Anaerolineaceae bacterium]